MPIELRFPGRVFVALAGAAIFLTSSAPSLTAADAPATARIVEAANHFLDTLDPKQRDAVQYELNDAEQRVRWSNLPVTMVKHGGLRMGDLNAEQRAAVWTMLRAALSKMGYEKVEGIVDADEELHKDGGNSMFGRDQFFVSFMGKPSTTEPWRIQYGGHHLALNITIAGDHGVLTPSLIAVQPAKYESKGKTVRPLGRETDLALKLVKSLDEDQRKAAVLGSEMRDLVLGPGHDGETIQPEGIQAGKLNADQRAMLLDLVSEWSGIINESSAEAKLAEVKSHLDDTWFAWSGPLESGRAYFRVQGPTVFIEFAPQRLGGDVTMHIHTMYRDPTNDYGRKWIAQ